MYPNKTGSPYPCLITCFIRSFPRFAVTVEATEHNCTVLSCNTKLTLGVYPQTAAILLLVFATEEANNISRPSTSKGISKYSFPSTLCNVIKSLETVVHILPLNSCSYLPGRFSSCLFFFAFLSPPREQNPDNSKMKTIFGIIHFLIYLVLFSLCLFTQHLFHREKHRLVMR